MTGKIRDKVRVGVIGVGIGCYHVEMYRAAKRCEMVALCDVDATRLAPVAKRYEIPHTFTDAQAMFDSGLIDAVSVATPNFAHHPLTMAALNSGVHVLCEKPLALNAKLAQQMVDTAKKKKLRLATHFNHRMTPAIQTIRRYVTSGELGEVYHLRTVYHRRRGIPGGAGGWFFRKKTAGGGCLIDLGVHYLDAALFIMGFPRVVSVTGQTHLKFGDVDMKGRDMDVDDFATAYLRLEGGATLAMEISWASHHEHPEQGRMAIYGTGGGVTTGTDHYKPIGIEVHRREQGNLVSTRVIEPFAACPTVQQDFVDAILDGREPACTGGQGLLTMKVLDAIYESSRIGREVRL
ncbi:MAG: Gfo/Idh/MocA family oxidoreductase [Planctomycetes bacterium]|nr:Gfo/Idh/MocA family oxidoreductase [Planctomycetota bacterium]